MFEGKKVCVICYKMVPYADTWGGAQRVFYYANALTKEGYKVDVIAGRGEKQFEDRKCDFNRIFYKAPINMSSVSSNRTQVTKKSLKGIIKGYIIKKVKDLDYSMNNDPDKGMGFFSQLWFHHNWKEIKQQMIKERYDYVIISAPPFGLFTPFYLSRIKKHTGCKLILDYRDPWNCWNDHKGLSLKREKSAVRLSDAIVVTNDNHRLKISEVFNYPLEKVFVVMNGYDKQLWNKAEKEYVDSGNNDKLVISIIGSIKLAKSRYRDASKLLRAIDKFPHKEDVFLRVVGTNELKENVQSIWNVDIPNFEIIPLVPQIESLKYMLGSDLLVNLHTVEDNSSRYLIAGKDFDYYRSGGLLFSINSSYSLEHKFIKDNELGYVAVNTEENIGEVLHQVYEKWVLNGRNLKKRTLPEEDVYSRDYQNMLWSNIFKQMS